jgi:hypothetical protein
VRSRDAGRRAGENSFRLVGLTSRSAARSESHVPDMYWPTGSRLLHHRAITKGPAVDDLQILRRQVKV